MSTHEVYAAFEFVYSTLASDATLMSLAPGGIWRSVAPERTPTPFVVMAYQAGTDTITANAVRLLTLPLMQVKCTGEASKTDAIAQAAARIDTLLTRVSGTVAGAYIHDCHRETPMFLDEIVAGELWSNIGGMYRMTLQQQ